MYSSDARVEHAGNAPLGGERSRGDGAQHGGGQGPGSVPLGQGRADNLDQNGTNELTPSKVKHGSKKGP